MKICNNFDEIKGKVWTTIEKILQKKLINFKYSAEISKKIVIFEKSSCKFWESSRFLINFKYRVIQIKCHEKLNATTKNSKKKMKHNSENVLQEILQQMFELTTRTLNTGLRAFDGIIDDGLQRRKWNSDSFTHYILLQVLKSCQRWWVHSIVEVLPQEVVEWT